jgi:hypothetical protein
MGHRQGRGWGARGAVAHADSHRAVGDPEPGIPSLGGELVHVRPGLGRLRGDGVDVDGLHGTVQLGDSLLQRHGLDELLGPLTG